MSQAKLLVDFLNSNFILRFGYQTLLLRLFCIDIFQENHPHFFSLLKGMMIFVMGEYEYAIT
jgi:hypothetical protein